MEIKTPVKEWQDIKEVSKSGRSIRFTAFLVKILPHTLLIGLTKVVTLFYFAATKWARKFSREYQNNLIEFSKNLPDYLEGTDLSHLPSRPNAYRHIASFATCLVEKIEGWSGKSSMKNIEFAGEQERLEHARGTGANGTQPYTSSTDLETVRNLLRSGKGCMLICSHLGNIELFRSIFSYGSDDFDHIIPVSIIMDQKVTQNFNSILGKLNSNARLNVISSDDISMATMSQLQDTIDQGGLVVISADRLPAHNAQRSLEISFLGKSAKLPYGPFLIAALLNCPTYFIFSMRKHQTGFDPTYIVNIIKSGVSFDGGRKERESKIAELAGEYTRLLEKFCLMYPYQWYNFYQYWSS